MPRLFCEQPARSVVTSTWGVQGKMLKLLSPSPCLTTCIFARCMCAGVFPWSPRVEVSISFVRRKMLHGGTIACSYSDVLQFGNDSVKVGHLCDGAYV